MFQLKSLMLDNDSSVICVCMCGEDVHDKSIGEPTPNVNFISSSCVEYNKIVLSPVKEIRIPFNPTGHNSDRKNGFHL